MLDPDQQYIANLTKGNYAVYAGPGSGKSRCALHRAANLVKLGSTVCLTFTSEAAKTLRTRAGKEFPQIDPSTFSTLHALALKFAHDYADAFPFQLSDNPLAGEGVAAKAVFEATRNKINYQAFTSWISLQKRSRIDPVQALKIAENTGKNLDMAIGYRLYDKALRKLGVLDFDDLLVYYVNVLETRPDIRSKQQYDFVIQDESQDSSEIEWSLLRLLTEKNKSLMAFGDVGQNLYTFRGASSEHFLNMEEYFPGTKKLYLGMNYRSTKSIVDFVKKSSSYPEIASHYMSFTQEEGVLPSIRGYSADFLEAEDVIKRVIEYGPDNCAILARTNLMLRACEEEAIAKSVKYHLLGSSGFWSQPEVQNLLYWIRVATTPTDNAVIGALRTPFWPTKYIKRKIISEEIKEETNKTGENAWDVVKRHSKTGDFVSTARGMFGYKNLPTSEAISKIIKDLKAAEYYRDEEGITPDRDPLSSLKELTRIAGKHNTLQDFLGFVRRVQGAERSRKGVKLSTIHSAKGSEAENVFLVSCNRDILPHVKSDDLQGEKNCYYTAVSRAQKTLHISWWGNPSIYLTGDRA